MFRNLKIRYKVFLLIFLIMTVSFTITYFILQYAYSIYDEQLYTKSSQVLNLSSSGIENELNKIDRLSFSVATDLAIQDSLSALTEETTDYNKNVLKQLIGDMLVKYAGYEKYIYSIEIMDTLGGITVAGQGIPYTTKKKQLMHDEATKGAGSLVRIYPDEADDSLMVVRDIRSYRYFDFNSLGTVIIRIRMDQIVSDVLGSTELMKGEFWIKHNESMIYPASGKLPDALVQLAPNHKQGYLIKEVNGQQQFISQIISGSYGWTFHSLIPYDQIFNQIIFMKRILWVFFIVSVLVVIVLAFSFSGSITKPMDQLMIRMKQYPRQDLTQAEAEPADLADLPMDEVGQLHRTFRMMMQQINELITENYTKQLTIKDTQFKALQAQINPHFLYNTLESINWLAKGNGQDQISKMVEALGFLLRSSISLKNTLVTIQDELDIVMNYMTIQKFRFEERLIFEIDVPARLREFRIPKLMIQPLLENAIHYALEPMIEPCTIRITAIEEQERIVLVVEDNGPGMSKDKLEQVRKGEFRAEGKGIGMKNIEERIVIAFGDPYGIHIESEQGKGTKVFIYLPYQLEG
jgi:two-component system sensor histidine kinase YesM